MPRYKVLRDCVGFKNGYWKEGQVVEFAAHEQPPHHFQLIDDNQPAPTPPSVDKEPQTMSEINKANAASRPTTGMAHVPSASAKPAEKAKSSKSSKK